MVKCIKPVCFPDKELERAKFLQAVMDEEDSDADSQATLLMETVPLVDEAELLAFLLQRLQHPTPLQPTLA